MTTNDEFHINAIATIATPFKQKFAIPRQANLSTAKGIISFATGFDDINMLKGIEGYSHLWLLFVFHETMGRGWKSTVKAPRLGGNATMGVLATRSTHRPNSIGMSVVKNNGIQTIDGKPRLVVEGIDLVDGTPIIDIKPYLHYADSIQNATDSLNQMRPIPQRQVAFLDEISPQLLKACEQHSDFQLLVREILAQDPRPAYMQNTESDDKTYRVTLYDRDIGFMVKNGIVVVTEINTI
ncbi:MAG: tRNA (N6-threonylcarbamoyladenosine(37)-N6)-methyltransferase TrmO [Alteromonas sp.]|jgi:tRNA-Thr(GGU) m(6)t(6)A37 methyltransferase TsaA|uniref:tRNA (N6-threonylcarbamoyladenosine(37)-N6)-methyltransferase TrmO n=1 Tax=Alteromonas sp. TaxID=232 RepID=UPI0032D980BE